MADRITRDPDRQGGAPCVRDIRIPVTTVLRHLADSGGSVAAVCQAYPDIESADVIACLEFAAQAVEQLYYTPESES